MLRFLVIAFASDQKCHKRTLQPTWSGNTAGWLGCRSFLRTTRWWSSRFDQREAHELTNPTERRSDTVGKQSTPGVITQEQTNYGKGEPAQVTRWLRAPDIPRLNASAPRSCESGKQLPAYKNKQASNAMRASEEIPVPLSAHYNCGTVPFFAGWELATRCETDGKPRSTSTKIWMFFAFIRILRAYKRLALHSKSTTSSC